MIIRFPGLTPTRSRAVVHDGLVVTVAVSPDADPGFYEQTQKALKRIDESLAMSGTDKSRILSVTIYLKDIDADYAGMNAVWDAWVAKGSSPARACVEAKMYSPEVLVEMTVVAALP